MEVYLGLSGQTYNVGDALSDKAVGAEGRICEIVGDTELVAKIYHDHMAESECAELESKLKLMINKKIVEAQGVFSIAWPRDILYKNSNGKRVFAGYTMRKVSASYNLFDLTHHNPDDPDPDPNGIDGYITWKEFIQAAYNLACMVEYLHKNGIEIGDFNEKNFLFDETTGGFDLIDCGAYGVFDTKSLKTIYPCRYSMPKYSAPEKLLGLDISNPKSTDCFYLAIHIFHLLMQNSEPFGYKENSDGNPTSKLHEHISNGDCLYVRSIPGKVLRKHSIKPGVLPDDILEAFNRTFNYTRDNIVSKIQNRTTASEWCKVLEPYLIDGSRITRCSFKKEHVYSSHLTECPWCNPSSVSDIPFEQRVNLSTGLTQLDVEAINKINAEIEDILSKEKTNDPAKEQIEKGIREAICRKRQERKNADQEAANKVKALIDAIGNVAFTEECRKRISTARLAYSKLTVPQRLLVPEDRLWRAEAEYESLKKKGKSDRPAKTGSIKEDQKRPLIIAMAFNVIFAIFLTIILVNQSLFDFIISHSWIAFMFSVLLYLTSYVIDDVKWRKADRKWGIIFPLGVGLTSALVLYTIISGLESFGQLTKIGYLILLGGFFTGLFLQNYHVFGTIGAYWIEKYYSNRIMVTTYVLVLFMFSIFGFGIGSRFQMVLNSVYTGDTITLGEYEQDGNLYNGSEALTWTVHEIKDGRALLLCDTCIAAIPFNSDGSDNSWGNSDIRNWLNGEFYNSAFSDNERNIIVETELSTGRLSDAEYHTFGETYGEDEITNDRVFVPDLSEFWSITDELLVSEIANENLMSNNPFWRRDYYRTMFWIRCPYGEENNYACGYDTDGEQSMYYVFSPDTYALVRPAVWIDVRSYSEYE